MRVADLQAFLQALVPPLVACAAKPANVEDLRRAILVLDTYADRTIAEFADFLTRCEEFARTGTRELRRASAFRRAT